MSGVFTQPTRVRNVRSFTVGAALRASASTSAIHISDSPFRRTLLHVTQFPQKKLIRFQRVSTSTSPSASDSLDEDGSSEHVHAANETDRAGFLGRELDDDGFVQWQRPADVQRRKHNFGAAGLVRRPYERNPRRL